MQRLKVNRGHDCYYVNLPIEATEQWNPNHIVCLIDLEKDHQVWLDKKPHADTEINAVYLHESKPNYYQDEWVSSRVSAISPLGKFNPEWLEREQVARMVCIDILKPENDAAEQKEQLDPAKEKWFKATGYLPEQTIECLRFQIDVGV